MLKEYFKSKSKRYLMITIMLSIVLPILAFSYSSFVFSSEDYRASEMYIGSLMYGIKIDGESTSSVIVPDGETEYYIEITSLNTVSSFYKLIYETNENIEVRYNKEENDVPSGSISNTRTVKISIINLTKEDIEVKFGIAAGYITNDLESVTIPEGYTEVKDFYENNDINVIALYVNDELVANLDENKDLYLDSYSCKNDESARWNNELKSLTITPVTEKTSCKLYFKDLVCDRGSATSGTLKYAMLNNNCALPDNKASDYVIGSNGIDFTSVSSDTNGKGLYYTTDLSKTEDTDGDGTGEKVYYFRGAVENNYVEFAGFCWRIIRTNEDGSVKLRYGGVYNVSDNVCTSTGSEVRINDEDYMFNLSYNDPKYVRYVYDGNVDSNAKSIIDAWYETNLSKYSAYINDTIYCNDTSVYNENSSHTQYSPRGRVQFINIPQYNCPNDDDNYTTPSGTGNGLLKYPVALLTIDEVMYAGLSQYGNNTTYYLYTAHSYWTMSPNAYSISNNRAYGLGVHAGRYANLHVRGYAGLLPAISLKSDVKISSGTGLNNNPYRVTTN